MGRSRAVAPSAAMRSLSPKATMNSDANENGYLAEIGCERMEENENKRSVESHQVLKLTAESTQPRPERAMLDRASC